MISLSMDPGIRIFRKGITYKTQGKERKSR